MDLRTKCASMHACTHIRSTCSPMVLVDDTDRLGAAAAELELPKRLARLISVASAYFLAEPCVSSASPLRSVRTPCRGSCEGRHSTSV